MSQTAEPNMTVSPNNHGFVTRGIHWLSAGLIAYGYIKGLDSVGQLSHPGVLQLEIAFALVLGFVFLFRLFWTSKIAGATRLPASAPKWEHLASRAVHYGLYASVFGIVLTGLGIAFAYVTPALGQAALWSVTEMHEAALAALPVLLALHIAGAVWHKLVRRDGVMESMTGRLPQR